MNVCHINWSRFCVYDIAYVINIRLRGTGFVYSAGVVFWATRMFSRLYCLHDKEAQRQTDTQRRGVKMEHCPKTKHLGGSNGRQNPDI